jgi:hypothetical protein
MSAELLARERLYFGNEAFIEVVMWRLDKPLRGSAHPFKYRTALVDKDACVLRYDNEAGKGDHVDKGGRERHMYFATSSDCAGISRGTSSNG